MGLREKKTARNRERMIRSALELFARSGYDGTTMEQIAEHAEVGTTTLYRYFPTKDLLLVGGLMAAIDLTPHLRARPAEESLDVALGEGLLAVARTLDDPANQIPELRRLIDSSSAPRARLWDHYRLSRAELEGVIGERMGASADALSVRMTAGLALELLQLVDEISLQSNHKRSHVEIVMTVLDQLPDSVTIVPTRPSLIAI